MMRNRVWIGVCVLALLASSGWAQEKKTDDKKKDEKVVVKGTPAR